MKYENAVWTNYMKSRKLIYRTLIPSHVESSLISEANWITRCHMESSEDMGFHVNKGDICYMDFGQAYLNEMGYQHFGLVLGIYNKKAMVIPMTSNEKTYARAYDPLENPNGKKHLMRIGLIRGLNRPSVLFLNDMKFVNTARVIEVKAHISHRSALFKSVERRTAEILFGHEHDTMDA